MKTTYGDTIFTISGEETLWVSDVTGVGQAGGVGLPPRFHARD